MRTKALLGLAALAASALTVAAQGNVYSLNIVGYVNVTVPTSWSILANPLSTGATNGAGEIIPPQDSETILTFTGAGYNYYYYDAGAGWLGPDLSTPVAPPQLPPGVGFFYLNPDAGPKTLTFVGQVVPNPGQTNDLVIPAGGWRIIGSPMPVGGSFGNVVNGPNAQPVPGALNPPVMDGETILTYVAGYNYFYFDSGSGGWLEADLSTPKTAPNIPVGTGFFFQNPQASAIHWYQTLP